MTQYFDETGKASPATIISAGPIVVTQVKTKDQDGYEAIQVGFGSQKKERLSKAVLGHLKDLDTFRHLREFKIPDGSFKKGDQINVSQFEEGDIVMVSGISKGKGFQGVVKRHGFAGGPRTHGQKHSEREPGAIGGGGGRAGGRVAKGIRMAGRMGGDRISVKNLKVLQVDKENNLLLVEGALPGRRGTLLEIKS